MVESEDPANLEINKHRFEKRGVAPDRERERESAPHIHTELPIHPAGREVKA